MPDLTEFGETQLAKLKPDHRNIVMDFEKFQHAGFPQKLFTVNLYRALSLYCGFIAHYNCGGFFEARFDDAEEMQQTFYMLQEYKYYHEDTRDLVRELQYSARINKSCWEARIKALASEEARVLRARADRLEGKASG